MTVRTLTFVACRLDSYAKTRFAELCHAASLQTQLHIVPMHVPQYENLGELLRSRQEILAWAPPIVALELVDGGVAHVLALPERHGLLTSNVAFIVRAQDTATTLDALQQRRVMWLDQRSASGYVIPRLHLAAQGYDPTTFFSQQLFGATHLAVLDAVSTGVVDVGTSWCRVEPTTRKVLDAGWMRADGLSIRPVRVAHVIGPVPNDAVLVSSKMVATDRSRLLRWLLDPSTESCAALKELMSTQVFRLPLETHFGALRHMLRAGQRLSTTQ
jgi:ABC-type phosphate/phosphonate transport system substrate-binding protein